MRDDHPRIRSDLSLLSQAVYVCELTDSFAEERSPSRDIYQLATVTLDLLPDSYDVWLVTRWFESRMLEVAGFRPELHSCVECGSELQPDDHMLDLAAGGVLVSPMSRIRHRRESTHNRERNESSQAPAAFETVPGCRQSEHRSEDQEPGRGRSHAIYPRDSRTQPQERGVRSTCGRVRTVLRQRRWRSVVVVRVDVRLIRSSNREPE